MPETLVRAEIAGVMLALCVEVGCGSKVNLAKISNPHLSLYLPTDSGRVVLSVVSATEPLPDTKKCELVARGARATLNGVPLKRERGQFASDDLAYNRDCSVEFTIPIASVPRTGDGATLQISDDSVTWTLELPTAFAPRTFTFRDASRQAVKRGSELSLRWSPPSDHLDPTWIALEIQRAGSEPGTGFVARDIKIDGAELSFRIPPTTAPSSAWSGPAWLRFLGTPGVKPKLGPCPVTSCSVTMQFDVPSLALTVEN